MHPLSAHGLWAMTASLEVAHFVSEGLLLCMSSDQITSMLGACAQVCSASQGWLACNGTPDPCAAVGSINAWHDSPLSPSLLVNVWMSGPPSKLCVHAQASLVSAWNLGPWLQD